MKPKTKIAIVLVTAPDTKVARKMAKLILQKRLAACANLVPKIESHYWWKDKIESATEVLMILKTTVVRLPQLQKCVLENHPYDTPEFVVLSVKSGNPRYFDWIAESVK